jgi:hypothetical protein
MNCVLSVKRTILFELQLFLRIPPVFTGSITFCACTLRTATLLVPQLAFYSPYLTPKILFKNRLPCRLFCFPAKTEPLSSLAKRR